MRAAGFTPRPLEEAGSPYGIALGRLAPGGLEAVAFAEPPPGLTLGVVLPLPPECEIAGLAPTAERSLKLLGAMMLGLATHGMQVTPVARYRGLEGLLLSTHLCRPGRAGTLARAACERLGRVAHLLARALREPPDRILVAVRQAAGVHGALVPAPERREAVRVPSFDAETARRPARKRPRAAR